MTFRTDLVLIAVIAMLSHSGMTLKANAQPASFDCSNAQTWSEHQVCSSPPLAATDTKIAELYREVFRLKRESERISLRSSQRDWMKSREACEYDAEPLKCLWQVYSSRMSALLTAAVQSIGPMNRAELQTYLQNHPSGIVSKLVRVRLGPSVSQPNPASPAMQRIPSTTITIPARDIAPSAGVSVKEYSLRGGPLGGVTAASDGSVWFVKGNDEGVFHLTASGILTTYSVHSQGSGIVIGPDGAIWFAEHYAGRIGRLTTDGSLTEYDAPFGRPAGITVGPDGALWFGGTDACTIGRITTGGFVTEFPVHTPGCVLPGLTTGGNSALWFTEASANKVGRITTSGAVTEFAAPSQAHGIVADPDDTLWFAEYAVNKIGRMTPSGVLTEYDVPTPGGMPSDVQLGPDRTIWFSELGSNKIGSLSQTGIFREYTPGTTAGPYSVAVPPDGSVWFSENATSALGHLVVATSEESVANPVHELSQSCRGETRCNAIQLPANEPWSPTGIVVQTGERLAISATGGVYVRLSREPDDYKTPAGDVGRTTDDEKGQAGEFVAPGLVPFSLVGKIGLVGVPFEIGAGRSIVAPVSGQLYLSVNDNLFSDNSGTWTVQVRLGSASSSPTRVETAYSPTGGQIRVMRYVILGSAILVLIGVIVFLGYWVFRPTR